MGVPPALSALWFPVKERTTATAIATILNSIGVGISFALGTSRLVQHIYMARNTQEHLQPSANALSPARLENQIKSTCNLYQTNHTRALINAIHWTDDHNKISF